MKNITRTLHDHQKAKHLNTLTTTGHVNQTKASSPICRAGLWILRRVDKNIWKSWVGLNWASNAIQWISIQIIDWVVTYSGDSAAHPLNISPPFSIIHGHWPRAWDRLEDFITVVYLSYLSSLLREIYTRPKADWSQRRIFVLNDNVMLSICLTLCWFSISFSWFFRLENVGLASGWFCQHLNIISYLRWKLVVLLLFSWILSVQGAINPSIYNYFIHQRDRPWYFSVGTGKGLEDF